MINKNNFYYLERTLKIDALTDAELEVLYYILNNIKEAQKLGVKGVAIKNFTSTATVMRVAKKLDYSGFSELVYDLKTKIYYDYESNNKLLNSQFNCNVKIKNKEDLTVMFNLIKNSVIYLYSEGFCEIITYYMYKKLLVLRTNPVLLHGLEIPIVYKDEKNPILLIISRSGETKTCLSKIDQMKNIGGKTIGFTSKHDSTLYKKSDIAYCIEDHKNIDSQNYYPTYFYGNCINLFEKIMECTFK